MITITKFIIIFSINNNVGCKDKVTAYLHNKKIKHKDVRILRKGCAIKLRPILTKTKERKV